ncbi:hypothetical protein CL617_04835 [archaeon]|nr:hypothetical protein [archaeon]
MARKKRRGSSMKNKKYTTFEYLYYSLLFAGIIVFLFEFLFWNFSWFAIRLWIVFSLILFFICKYIELDT